ncbi:MAG: NAD(P)-binding domain-containing protein [Thermodesulfobacteriota bacterium]
MKKIGFIGYGHMGSVLLNSLLSAHALDPHHILIATRTRRNLDALKATYPAIAIAVDNHEVAEKSALVFLCVGTYQVKEVLAEILPALHAQTHLVTISGGLELASIARIFKGAVTKIMPTLIAEVHEGVTLICHNQYVQPPEREFLVQMFRHIGEVKEIQEYQFELGADLTSCAPGLLASICDQFVKAVVKHQDFTYAEAAEMLLQTLYGTAKLLRHNQEMFTPFINRVATKGGATEGGVGVLEAFLPDIFDRMLTTTLQRHDARKQQTRQQFMET